MYAAYTRMYFVCTVDIPSMEKWEPLRGSKFSYFQRGGVFFLAPSFQVEWDGHINRVFRYLKGATFFTTNSFVIDFSKIVWHFQQL